MGLWDKVKVLFGGKMPLFDADDRPTEGLRRRMTIAAEDKVAQQASFSRRELAVAVLDAHQVEQDERRLTLAGNVLLELRARGWFNERGYESRDGNTFAPRSPGTGTSPPATTGATQFTTGSSPAPTSPAASPRQRPPDPLAGGKILGLNSDQLRKRAMKITPWRTAWIGRVDVIPPQSDERTALVDRGLVLRGMITEAELEEIHRIGDLWLQHSEKAKLAREAAAAKTRQDLDELAQERRRLKAQKKKEAAERKAARAAAIAHRRANDIIYLGPGVSGRLGDRRTNVEALEDQGLPVLATPKDVAEALEISIPSLRWLCYHQEAVGRSHYVYFEIPKRSGGKRLLAAPHRRLAAAQRWILDNILAVLDVEEPAHGFVKGRSVASNAAPHVGRDVVLNFDLQDFFPSITFGRVRGVFETLGYSPAVATILALLCTECPRRKITYAGETYWVSVGARGLPQGACTSPALSNRVARRLDRRLQGMASKHGWAYTRYADDLTFSAPEGHRKGIPLLMARVRHIVGEESFALNVRKGRIQRKGRRQTVTGIVVNDKPGLDRREVRRLRAILHQAGKTGLAAQNREGREDFEAWLRGKIAYLSMIDRDKGQRMRQQLDVLVGR